MEFHGFRAGFLIILGGIVAAIVPLPAASRAAIASRLPRR